MSEILFPQPEVERPGSGDPYYLGIPGCQPRFWCGSVMDNEALAYGLVYLRETDALQRLAYDLQENAKRIIPQWFRDLGPDVEVNQGLGWVPASWGGVADWSAEKPENYRAKPKQIVRGVVVDGVLTEYRWAEPANDKPIIGYFVNSSGAHFFVSDPNGGDDDYIRGQRAHKNKADAEAMCAALNAVLGVK